MGAKMPNRATESGRRGDGVGLCGAGAFTLIELLVVISIISMLASIALPVFGRVRGQVRSIINQNNQGHIAKAVTLYVTDDSYDRLPETVATIGFAPYWNWHDPGTLTGKFARAGGCHRAMSGYLGGYIEDADTVYCPNAPRKFRGVERVWEAGDGYDEWERTDGVWVHKDSFIGTYCFYWGYEGYLGAGRKFKGPTRSAKAGGESGLLVSDRLVRNQYRMYQTASAAGGAAYEVGRYGSCEWFANASSTKDDARGREGNYWYTDTTSAMPKITLYAGYIDGSVRSYESADTIAMKVIMNRAANTPYPDSSGIGEFFIPANAQ
jgi:prepilin-type N-terminal cleavage/methylation domain-containing protein